MIFGIRKKYWGMLTAAAVIGLMVGIFKFTDAFALRNVSITPETYDYLIPDLNLPLGENIFGITPNDAMDRLLTEDDILSVEWDYLIPGEIRINLNDCEPLALIIPNNGQSLLAMDFDGYLYPYKYQTEVHCVPVITNCDDCRVYKRTADNRILLVLKHLKLLREYDEEFYRLISGIDMSDQKLISVFIEGLSAELLIYPGNLYPNITDLKDFLLEYNPNLEQVKKLDFMSEGLIIAVN